MKFASSGDVKTGGEIRAGMMRTVRNISDAISEKCEQLGAHITGVGAKRIGRQSLAFPDGVWIVGRGNVVGKKEGEGPLGRQFDKVLEDEMFGEKSWELAESKMLETAMNTAMERAGLTADELNVMLSGDLINQIMSSSFTARAIKAPFLGLYGACSTMAEALLLGSVMVDGGFVQNALAGASSHFCTAERQFRLPVEHGNQRPPSAQWTATAAGAVVLASSTTSTTQNMKKQIRVTGATIGKVIDAGIKDANQMGAAMAPAAVDTLLNHLEDTGRTLGYYDLVATGDLGFVGKDIMRDLLVDAGLASKDVFSVYDDCGCMLFKKEQDVHGGGSGCGCSAVTLTGHILPSMEAGQLRKVLLISTGALLSTVSPLQGESIPGIGHAVALEVA